MKTRFAFLGIGLLLGSIGTVWFLFNDAVDAVGSATATPSPPVFPLPGIEQPGPDRSSGTGAGQRIQFSRSEESSGVDFTYYGSPTDRHYMTELNGGGVSLFDADADGHLDIFLVNGSDFDRPAEQAGASSQLYLATGNFAWQAVTKLAGLESCGFGMGCAAADYDNDGFTDLFVGYYGQNRLWRNNGDGTFTEMTEVAGLGHGDWASSSAFGDLDGDGCLDLYVCNYVEWSPDEPPCYSPHETPIHIACGPMDRSGQSDVLYHNAADGRFLDVSVSAGVQSGDESKSLAVEIVDLDEDGRLDIYVANDTTANHFFHNAGNMQFTDFGLVRGVAVGEDGIPQASMGIAASDFNRNGHFDLFLTNFASDVNDFYENLGPETGFRPANAELGFDTTSRPLLGFGTVAADFDLDQWPDIFVANGHIWDFTPLGMDHQYAMSPLLFQNLQGQSFSDVSPHAGPYFREDWLGRSVAVGDLDNDGDPDLVVSHLMSPACLLRNDSQRAGRGVRLRLIGTEAARQPAGIRADVIIDGERLVLRTPAGGSFQSTSDPRIIVPTLEAERIDEILIHWGPERQERWKEIAVNDDITLIQGTGEPVGPPE